MIEGTDFYVSLRGLAKEFGWEAAVVREFAFMHGVTPRFRRTLDSGKEMTLAISRSEADLLRSKQLQANQTPAPEAAPSEKVGVFYVIRLVPDLDPRRVKIGFAEDFPGCLEQVKSGAPSAAVARTWPCKVSWGQAAVDCLTAVGMRRVMQDTYDCENVEALLRRAEAFFALLPNPTGCTPFTGRRPAKFVLQSPIGPLVGPSA